MAKGKNSSTRAEVAAKEASLAEVPVPRRGIFPPALVSYWEQSARPWTSLLFVLPALLLYEYGVWGSGEGSRNAADQWLRYVLGGNGLLRPGLLPAIMLGWLLAAHYLGRHAWNCSPRVLAGMALESALLAGLLLVVASGWGTRRGAADETQGRAAAAVSAAGHTLAPADPYLAATPRVRPQGAAAVPQDGSRWWVAYLGAGIYEEVFFRLLLLNLLAAIGMALGASRGWSGCIAIGVSSFFFALAHYETLLPQGEVLDSASFQFRWSAGILFGALYYWRGFGIAVGSHTLYDLLVGWLQQGT